MNKKIIEFFQINRRVARKEFSLFCIGALVVPFFAFSLLGSSLLNILSIIWIQANIYIKTIYLVFFICIQLIAIIKVVLLSIWRLHDHNLSAWLSLLYLMPGVNIVFLMGLLIFRWTLGPNRFWGDPLWDEKPSKFTPIIVILIIIGICVFSTWAVSLPTKSLLKARDNVRIKDIEYIQKILGEHYGDKQYYPDSLANLSKYGYAPIPQDWLFWRKEKYCTLGYVYEPIMDSKNENCGYHLSVCMEAREKQEINEKSHCK